MRPLALAVFASLASLASAQQKPETVITFELEANLIWVDVTMDGKGPFRMAVDTGASVTVVLPDVAKEMGLIDKDDPGGGWFGLSPDFVSVKKMKVGALEVEKVKVAVMSIPQLSLPAGIMKMKAHGVLGYNFISRFVTTFDYKKQTITFVENDYVPADPSEELPGVRKPPKAHLGVRCEPVPARDVRMHGYDGGLKVESVEEISPAEKAGIKEGDIIVDVAGAPTVTADALKNTLRRLNPGQKIVVTFIREGELWETDVVIGRTREK